MRAAASVMPRACAARSPLANSLANAWSTRRLDRREGRGRGPGVARGRGSDGRYTVPVRIVIKSGPRHRHMVDAASIAIPAGDTQAFTLVEEGLLVAPADAESFEIEVGLGGAGGRRRG